MTVRETMGCEIYIAVKEPCRAFCHFIEKFVSLKKMQAFLLTALFDDCTCVMIHLHLCTKFQMKKLEVGRNKLASSDSTNEAG